MQFTLFHQREILYMKLFCRIFISYQFWKYLERNKKADRHRGLLWICGHERYIINYLK